MSKLAAFLFGFWLFVLGIIVRGGVIDLLSQWLIEPTFTGMPALTLASALGVSTWVSALTFISPRETTVDKEVTIWESLAKMFVVNGIFLLSGVIVAAFFMHTL